LAYFCGNLALEFLPRHKGLRVLLQMKLAPLPRHTSQHGVACCLKSCVRVTNDKFNNDKFNPTQPALNERRENRAPMQFLFAHRNRQPRIVRLPVVSTLVAIRTAASRT
jgi:hypothetical protein